MELLPVDGITSAAGNLARAGQMSPQAMRRNARVALFVSLARLVIGKAGRAAS
jgi:hypothetical protein